MVPNIPPTGTTPRELPPKPVEVPTFLQTAGKTTKYIVAFFLTLAGVGSLAIGITFFPFSKNLSGIALGFSATSFGLAAYLFWGDVPQATPNNVTVIQNDCCNK